MFIKTQHNVCVSERLKKKKSLSNISAFMLVLNSGFRNASQKDKFAFVIRVKKMIK